ncbi:phytosulfokines 3 [Ziziphus jujuba]|uniref:Phytosulfokine n=1 Tax=Ziziphus jujuba TaxID=326968 RepID=A0A6P4B8Y9_ZIZJJ|nr:phytosulfokines 3 [Ziziphus jujuba]
MAKRLNFFILVLLLLSCAETRPIPNTILQESAYPNIPNALSPEEAIMEDGGCKGLENEECLIRRSMAAHTDYIYTQDITGP